MSSAPPLDLRRAIVRGLASSASGLLVVVAVLVLVSRSDLGTDSVGALWARAQVGPIVLASVLMSAAFLFMGLRWRALMPPGHRPPAAGLTLLLLAGLLLNYALPGPMGDLAASWFAHRRYKVPLADSLASGIVARLIGLITAAMLALGVWLFAAPPVPEGYERWVGAAAVLVGLGGVALAAAAAFPRPWAALSERVLERLAQHRRLERPARRAIIGLGKLAEALAAVATRGWRAYLRAGLWALAGHLTVTTGIAWAAAAFGVRGDPAGLLFTYTLSTAGAVLMFAFPGSQLSWDAGFTALLVGACGLRLTDALAVATLVRLQQVVLQALGGAALTWLMATEGAPTLSATGSPPTPDESEDLAPTREAR